MKNLLLLLLLSSGVVVAAAQKSEIKVDSFGIPIIAQKKTAAIAFRAAFEGKPVKIERIDTPETAPLRILVIDLREVGAIERKKDELARLLRSINLTKLRAQAGLIKIGRSAEKIPPPAGWQLYTSPDFETALRQAETLFAAGTSSERQSLLIIKNSPPEAEIFNGTSLQARVASPAGRLLAVLPATSPSNAGNSGEAVMRKQLEEWRDSLSSLYVLRIAAKVAAVSGGRIDAEAVWKNKVIGRGSKQIDSAWLMFSDEVETAFADYSRVVRFETMDKYPGLPESELLFFKNHYDPPIEGVVIDSDPGRHERLQKLSSRVFRIHQVEKQCAVVLLDSRLPTVFTWKLTFVSLTNRVLEILNDDEITALIAHEIGHLYFADDLAKARTLGDDRLSRIAELKCDLIALETLRRLKINESNLLSAIDKLIETRSALNIKSLQGGSPVLDDRRRIVRRYLENRSR